MSYKQADLTHMNSANGVSALPLRFGHRMGRGRALFNATDTAAHRTIAAHGLVLTVPAGAIVTNAFYVVSNTFTSATDAATIALKVEAAGDVVAAAAISTGTTWDASTPVQGLPVASDLTKAIVTTIDREVTATVAVEVLTAGRMCVFVEWVYVNDAYYL